MKRRILDDDKIEIDLDGFDSSKKPKIATPPVLYSAGDSTIASAAIGSTGFLAPEVGESSSLTKQKSTTLVVSRSLGDASIPVAPTSADLSVPTEASAENGVDEVDPMNNPSPEASDDLSDDEASESGTYTPPDQSSDEGEDDRGDAAEHNVVMGDHDREPRSVRFEWVEGGPSAEGERLGNCLGSVTTGLSGITEMFASYEADIKTLRAENSRLRRRNKALEASENARVALHREVVGLRTSNVYLDRLAVKVPELRAEIKELKKTRVDESVIVKLRTDIAALKHSMESDEQFRHAELAALRRLHERELFDVGREVFKRTKALYAPLIEKIKAYVAERGPMTSTLLNLTREEGTLISLTALGQAGVTVPEDLKLQAKVSYEEARTAVIAFPGVEISEWDLAEPDRSSFKKIMDEAKQASRDDTAKKTTSVDLEDDGGAEPK